MTTSDLMTLYFASLAVIGGLAGYVITHLLSEIKRHFAYVVNLSSRSSIILVIFCIIISAALEL